MLTLLPLTVATFTQLLSVTLLLSLDLRHCSKQAENTLLLSYTHWATRKSSCAHSFRVGRTLKSPHWFVVVTVLSVIWWLVMFFLQMFPASLSPHNMGPAQLWCFFFVALSLYGLFPGAPGIFLLQSRKHAHLAGVWLPCPGCVLGPGNPINLIRKKRWLRDGWMDGRVDHICKFLKASIYPEFLASIICGPHSLSSGIQETPIMNQERQVTCVFPLSCSSERGYCCILLCLYRKNKSPVCERVTFLFVLFQISAPLEKLTDISIYIRLEQWPRFSITGINCWCDWSYGFCLLFCVNSEKTVVLLSVKARSLVILIKI